MKSIVTTDITTSAAAKIKKGTLNHINAMTKEAPVELAKAFIDGGYDATKAYILYGCDDTNSSATVFDMTAGCVLWGGVLYMIPAQSITVSAGQTIRFWPTVGYTTSAEADPVTFTDGSTHNIHLDDTGTWLASATGATATIYDNMVKVFAIPTVSATSLGSKVASSTVKFRRNKFGFVSLQGTITFTASASTTETAFTLPSGYWPTATQNTIAVLSGTLTAFVSISSSGVVTCYVTSGSLGSTSVNLDNIHFYAN